jgi:hypothetical protein
VQTRTGYAKRAAAGNRALYGVSTEQDKEAKAKRQEARRRRKMQSTVKFWTDAELRSFDADNFVAHPPKRR